MTWWLGLFFAYGEAVTAVVDAAPVWGPPLLALGGLVRGALPAGLPRPDTHPDASGRRADTDAEESV
ncbi:hypothetical protein [Streptomyces sp. NE06-03C]|uniref:hypothetical protein n=1 Tax=Streptomyces sp. NE06-03C TaxID=3028694 RepID=UPI0029AF2CDD|nr:hypothetical protein [Streptomyces sp. NE06-03C]MDX2919687.1 hypothetical protein [Streptomyces sp. NE06-03C]